MNRLPRRIAVVLLGTLYLVGTSACGLVSPTRTPAPRTPGESGAISDSSRAPESDTDHARKAARRDVVQTFLQTAREHVRNGNLAAARESIHRGLNIDADHPGLWYELARVRERQDQFTKAETLAFRSLELSDPSSELHRKNWSLIARVRERLGDHDGAREARIQARRAR